IEFVFSDPPVQQLFLAGRGVEGPAARFVDQGERKREPVISHAEHGFVATLHLNRGLLLKRRDEALPRPRVLYGVTAEDPVLASGSEDAHDRIDITALCGIG